MFLSLRIVRIFQALRRFYFSFEYWTKTLLLKQIMLGIRNETNERRVAANAAEVSNN